MPDADATLTLATATTHITDTPRPLPDGWRWARLGDVCTLIVDSIDPQRFPDEIFAHYSIPAFDAAKSPVFEPGSAILSTKTVLDEGAVLFSKLNPRIPRAWFVNDRHTQRRICSTEFLPLKPDRGCLLPEYLTGVLQSPQVIARLRAAVAAATKSRERLRPNSVMTSQIPLPPLAEQRRIAAILAARLAAVERARAATQAQLEAAQALSAAELRAIFESNEAQAWPVVSVRDVSERIDYGYTASAVPAIREPLFLRITDIQNGGVDWDAVPGVTIASDVEKSYMLKHGDIVFARTGGTTGKSYLVVNPPRTVFASYLIRIRPAPSIDPRYLYLFFQSDGYWIQIHASARGGAQPNVNATLLGEICLPLPDLVQQQHIAAMLDVRMAKIARLRASLAAQLDTINALPAALLRQAFNGEL